MRRQQLTALVLLTAALLMGTVRLTYADGVDDYLKAQMATRHIPGLSVAVVQDGKVVKAQGYGLSDASVKTPAAADTVYQIGSLTKQFTAAAVLTLVQQGKIGVDDPITKYISGVPSAWNAITVRELLNQTSGIRNYREFIPDVLTGGAAKDYTAAQVVQMASTKPLLFAPGTQFAYSNTNYHLLGMIVEKASGKSYADYLRRTFFGPLGMTATRMEHPGLTLPNLAVGSVWDGKTTQAFPIVFSPTINFGDGGVLSSVTDLTTWNAALDGEALLTPDSKRLLWTPPTLTGGAATEYASGWFSATVQGHQLRWHNGATIAGFTGAIFKFPADKLTLIVLTNSLDVPGAQTSIPLYSLMLGLTKLYLPDAAKIDAGIPDTDPQTAALLKTALAQIASGKLDLSQFTPKMQTLLDPSVVGPVHDMLAPLGPLTSLTLIRRASDGSARYRALYGTTALDWLIVVDKDHKIAGLRLLPE